MSKNCQKLDFFFKLTKNDNFCQLFWKKNQVFGNFLTVNWQFFGGSGGDFPNEIFVVTG